MDLGATVLSWRPAGQREVLFLSRDAVVAAGHEIHGGVPVCAPWFGTGRPGTRVPHAHGLVRWLPWRLTEHRLDGWTWRITAATMAHLPGAADYPSDLEYWLRATVGRALEISLTVVSPSTEFILDQALHAYFAVEDVTRCELRGLEGAAFRDVAVSEEPRREDHPLRIHGNTDRIYDVSGPLELVDGDRAVHIRAEGAASTVVWNPGPGATLPGLAESEWRHMVCVEVGNVQERAVTVAAGGRHTLTLRISLG